MCTFRSPHTASGFHFCHRLLLWALPLLLASTATLWLHTLVLGPVTSQMSEVCGDSKIDGTHLHVILNCQYYFSSPADSKGHLN
ncbi:unnamed protein product [Staurois parvus]|uniref:Uncharacterized protein n=1 Tax=Staurois parvus TaxID=386267 RepID=A0ABN9BFN8_9NEOB|nr:unnamed protein product [Staurois parvus]